MLQALTGELATVRGFAESLRAQTHEAVNRLYTVVSLVELGRLDESVEFATAELRTAQYLTDRVVGAAAESVLAALLLGKSTAASERGVELVITEGTELNADGAIESRDLVTVFGQSDRQCGGRGDRRSRGRSTPGGGHRANRQW